MRPATRSGLVLPAMAAAVAIVTLDTTILNVAIPTIRRDLHTTLASLQWVIAGYSLTLGSLLIIGGRVGGEAIPSRRYVALYVPGRTSLNANRPFSSTGAVCCSGMSVSQLDAATCPSGVRLSM